MKLTKGKGSSHNWLLQMRGHLFIKIVYISTEYHSTLYEVHRADIRKVEQNQCPSYSDQGIPVLNRARHCLLSRILTENSSFKVTYTVRT